MRRAILRSRSCRATVDNIEVYGMKPYIGLIHQDAGSAYGITFPDAPGCFSAADGLDDIFSMAGEALGLWLEEMTAEQARLPAVRELSEIKSDPRWAEAFAGAVLVIAVAVPPSELRHAA